MVGSLNGIFKKANSRVVGGGREKKKQILTCSREENQ